MKKHLQRWGAAYILLVMWASSTLAYYRYEKLVAISEAKEHKEPFQYADFWNQFMSGIFENLQSEWAQLLVQAILLLSVVAYYVWRADEQASKEDVKEILNRLDKIEEGLTDSSESDTKDS